MFDRLVYAHGQSPFLGLVLKLNIGVNPWALTTLEICVPSAAFAVTV